MSDVESQGFPTTRWTFVGRAGAPGAAGGEAMALLLGRYLPPLRVHLVLDKRIAPDKADDLVQSFVAQKVLDHRLFSSADRDKGRFRTFLLLALDRFVANQLRNERRKCRHANAQVSLDAAAEVGDEAPGPASAFDIAWARQVLVHAATAMHQECGESGRTDVWRIFDARVLSPTLEGSEPVSYERLVAEVGLPSADAASNLLVTGKRMFARRLRAVVGEYMDEGGDVDEEIADLREILSRARS